MSIRIGQTPPVNVSGGTLTQVAIPEIKLFENNTTQSQGYQVADNTENTGTKNKPNPDGSWSEESNDSRGYYERAHYSNGEETLTTVTPTSEGAFKMTVVRTSPNGEKTITTSIHNTNTSDVGPTS